MKDDLVYEGTALPYARAAVYKASTSGTFSFENQNCLSSLISHVPGAPSAQTLSTCDGTTPFSVCSYSESHVENPLPVLAIPVLTTITMIEPTITIQDGYIMQHRFDGEVCSVGLNPYQISDYNLTVGQVQVESTPFSMCSDLIIVVEIVFLDGSPVPGWIYVNPIDNTFVINAFSPECEGFYEVQWRVNGFNIPTLFEPFTINIEVSDLPIINSEPPVFDSPL